MAVGRKPGIGDLQLLLNDAGHPAVANRVAHLSRSRRAEAHPDVELVKEVVAVLDEGKTQGKGEDYEERKGKVCKACNRFPQSDTFGSPRGPPVPKSSTLDS